MADYLIAPGARLDLQDVWLYFADEVGNVNLADRFSARAQLTFARLARSPGLGRRWKTHQSDSRNLQQWRVDRFPNLLVFYRQHAGSVEIVRVLHGARNLEATLSASLAPIPAD